jgi:hypothetical protein
VPGENLVGPAVPSDTAVPLIFHKSNRQPLQAFRCSSHHQNEDRPTREPKFSLGETPFSIKEGMSIQTTLLHLVYLF